MSSPRDHIGQKNSNTFKFLVASMMISHPVLCNHSSYAADGHPFLNSTSRTTTGLGRSTPFTTRWTVAPTLTTSPQENFQNRALYYHTYNTSLHGRQRATAVTRTYFSSPRPSLAETVPTWNWTSCIKHGERNIRETTKKHEYVTTNRTTGIPSNTLFSCVIHQLRRGLRA